MMKVINLIKWAILPFLLMVSCATPDTQPIIDSVLHWKKMEDDELAKHKQLLSVAKFDNDLVKNANFKASYTSAIDLHARVADQYANSIVSWAQRVGKFDERYANQTLDQMIMIYKKVRKELGDK